MSSDPITIGVTLPSNIAIALGLALGIAVLSAFIFFARPIGRHGRERLSRSGALGFLNVFAAVLAPVWLFLFAHIIWSLWQLAITFEPTEKGEDLRWHILAFIGLITALGGLISAPLALIRVWTTERQTRTSEQGHMTDRISKAVEQLGAEKTVKKLNDESQTVETSEPNIEVRIGGLLSLERIAQDSTAYDKGRDHVRVMEILCAYVRENSAKQRGFVSREPEEVPQTRIDIQTALSVIGRRSLAQIQHEEFAKFRLDFRNTDLSSADFKQASLRGALFSNCCLEHCDFREADLTAARLDECTLNGTVFWDATIDGTIFDHSKITRRQQPRFSFTKDNFRCASIDGADFSGIYLGKRQLTPAKTYGSADTKLKRNEDEVSRKFLASIDTHNIADDDEEFRARAEHSIQEIEASPYRYWTPYGSNDLANGKFSSAYKNAFGLTGWPYDDT